MANEEFKFFQSGDICDTKIVFEDHEENTPGWVENDLFDTLEECCANTFAHDLGGCMDRSPVTFKFDFCVDIEGLVEPMDCQSADIYANVLEDALNVNAGIGGAELDANITRIGEVSLTKVAGSTVCGGSLEGQGYTNQYTGSTPNVDAAAGVNRKVCGVMSVKAADGCKETECMSSQYEDIKQALLDSDVNGDLKDTIQSKAKVRLPSVPELFGVDAENLDIFDVLFPPSVSGDFEIRFFRGTDLSTCQSKPTLAFADRDERFETLHSCCVQHFGWDVNSCCVNGGGCPEIPNSDAAPGGWIPTWVSGELCKYKAGPFEPWEEKYDTLEECCDKKFNYNPAHAECMTPNDIQSRM